MTAADHSGPRLDLYQLLGVPPDASRDEIALAWRRRARDEHPGSRPGDAGAPDRFCAPAEAWQVLGDPARRAAYDRALTRERPPTIQVTVRHQPGPGGVAPLVRMPGPPLRVGPVRIEASHPAPSGDGWAEEDMRLALLAELALRHLARDRRRPS